MNIYVFYMNRAGWWDLLLRRGPGVFPRPGNGISLKNMETIKGSYDVLGRRLSTSANLNNNYHRVTSGVYFDQMERNGMAYGRGNDIIR
jgi:hypothetical protein